MDAGIEVWLEVLCPLATSNTDQTPPIVIVGAATHHLCPLEPCRTIAISRFFVIDVG